MTEATQNNGKSVAGKYLPWILFCLGFFFSVWDLKLKWNLGGFNFRLYQAVFGLLFLLLLAGNFSASAKALISLFRTPFYLLFSAIMFFYLVGVSWSFFPIKSFAYSVWILFDLITIGSCLVLLGKRSEALLQRVIVLSIWLTLLFNSVVIWIDFIAYKFGYTDGLIGFNQDSLLHWGTPRPHSFAGEPSYISAFLATGILFLLPDILLNPSRRWLKAVGAVVTFAAIVFCTSRTGIISLLLGLPIIFLFVSIQNRKIPLKEISIFALTMIFFSGIYWFSSSPKQRESIHYNLVSTVFEARDSSVMARVKAHITAYEIAKETHWIGAGIGASYTYYLNRELFPHLDSSHYHRRPSDDNNKEVVMSVWGQLFAEGGIPVFVLFFFAALSLIYALNQAWKRTVNPMVLGALCSAAIYFFFTLFWLGNIARGDSWVWYSIWIACAICLNKNEPDPNSKPI